MQPPVKMVLPVNSRDMVDVDTILDRAIAAGDPLIAAEYGNQLSNTITLKGIALAKLFWGLKSNWALFRSAGIEEDFGDFVDAHMMVKGRTADKYADMFEAVFVNAPLPDNLKRQLAQKPMQSLLLLTAAVREGSLDTEDLEDVVVLDHNGIREKVREARGEATNSRTAVYARLVQRDHSVYPKGTLVVFGTDSEGHENIEAIGSLNLNPRTESGQKYVQRIINALGLEDIR
jgi:hypothetical protein